MRGSAATLLTLALATPSLAVERAPLQLDLSGVSGAGRPAWEQRPAVARATEVPESTHIVKAGESLRAIGERTGAGADAIARANGLPAPYAVQRGQVLRIPGGRYHRVGEGETGIAIARAYGIRWNRIVAANALTEPVSLRVGQRLVLPFDPEAAGDTRRTPEQRAAAFRLDINDILTGSEPARRRPVAAAPTSVVQAAGIGRFGWPATGAVVGRFGAQGRGQTNQGIDIASGAGNEVVAAAPGTIAFVGSGVPGYGGLILLRHDGGWISVYGRVASASVRNGASVRGGQALGRAGGEPLQFQLRRGKTPVDPLRHLPRR